MPISVKICGLKTESAVKAAVDGGAKYLGFNFFPPSPRLVSVEKAVALAKLVPPHIKKVALFVDADDAALERVLLSFHADIIQLHGSETPSRCEAIKAKWGKPIIKAFAISEADDIEETMAYESVVDYFLFDARAPEGSDIPGGNAVSFNWGVLAHQNLLHPWFLAGGIHARNVQEAVQASGARMVDVASGVERVRGEKDESLITDFLALAQTL